MDVSRELDQKKVRKAIAWRLVGRYESDEEILAAKGLEKVSKKKTDVLKAGVKVTYRCNLWKKTRCPYQIYALYGSNGIISLYEGGTHDHANIGDDSRTTTFSFPDGTFEKSTANELPKSIEEQKTEDVPWNFHFPPEVLMVAQDELLATLLQQAQSMANSSAEIDSTVVNDHDNGFSLSDSLFLNKLNENGLLHPKEEDGSSSSASGLISNPSDFNLSDGITALLQIASDADLAFSFNSRSRAEYCFSSNQRSGRSVAFSDMGADIRVAQKVGDEEVAVETWRKSDWSQFCWAVRGTCLHFLKN